MVLSFVYSMYRPWEQENLLEIHRSYSILVVLSYGSINNNHNPHVFKSHARLLVENWDRIMVIEKCSYFLVYSYI